MILQALHDYYVRKSADPDAHMAPAGFEWKEMPFIIELSQDGDLIQIEDTRKGEGKKKIARKFLVPQGVKKTSGVAANLFWDNAEYVLGVDTKGKPKRVREQHSAFVERITALPTDAQSDLGIQAVQHFLGDLDLSKLEHLPVWAEIAESNPNLSFRLHGEINLVCQCPAVASALKTDHGQGKSDGFCLVTGAPDEIERLHTSIKGVWGAQSSGANIVSFNLDAFNSYGKAQGGNAPVGKRAAFRYTTALNLLLAKDSRQRIQVGDASTVFWAEKANVLESEMVDIFGEPPKDDPDRNVRVVESLYRAVQNGAFAGDEGKTRFYVLGLAPNAARIAIRFWHVSTVAEIATHIRQHFDDLEIAHAAFEKPYLSLFRLLVSTATQGKAENIPPNLGGDVMRCILAGTPYPQTLLQAVVRRVHAERQITYPRAALIKACINRQIRYDNTNEKELTVSLDESNPNVGYRLGRLFAVLEKIQEEANPGINATIRDRFYGAASSTPVTVFSTLMKLKNHHLAKLENRGRAVNFEKLIGQIMDDVQDFPVQLTLANQGRFAIGYYHQQQAFYQKSASKSQGE
ncbi:MAG: type I-C CRISPR-associated protein Cas8c/Csd1 [Sulfuricella sp.]|nr:type I-C CRISPR-associated protein Cas8c/Csd1 [Sulfuricella sp.]